MDTYQKVTIYLESLLQSNEIEDFAIVGIQGDKAYAKIVKTYFENAKFYYVLIKPYLDTYKYLIVENFEQFNNVDNEVLNVLNEQKDIIKKILMFVGESLPKTNINDNNQFQYDKTDLTLDTWKYIIETYPNIVDNSIIEGFQHLQVPDADLTSENLTIKNKMREWIYKLNSRYRIEKEVGDTNDLLADVSKRISLIERLVMRMAADYFEIQTLPIEYKNAYTTLISNYLGAFDAGYFLDRTDLEDPGLLFSRLMERTKKIADIINEEYFSKID